MLPLWPAGWPLRFFSVEALADLFAAHRPGLVEISKDLLDDGVSLKELARVVGAFRASGGAELSYAGTTDFVKCAGFSWERYRSYLEIQLAQARFLECSMFRVLLGERRSGGDLPDLLERVRDFCADAAPMTACIEIHGGIESDPDALGELLQCAPVKIVIDFENMRRAGLTPDDLVRSVPPEKIAYFHQRNLPDVWIEDPATLEDEVYFASRCPGSHFLWEPKTVDDPRRIRELLLEYQTSH